MRGDADLPDKANFSKKGSKELQRYVNDWKINVCSKFVIRMS